MSSLASLSRRLLYISSLSSKGSQLRRPTVSGSKKAVTSGPQSASRVAVPFFQYRSVLAALRKTNSHSDTTVEPRPLALAASSSSCPPGVVAQGEQARQGPSARPVQLRGRSQGKRAATASGLGLRSSADGAWRLPWAARGVRGRPEPGSRVAGHRPVAKLHAGDGQTHLSRDWDWSRSAENPEQFIHLTCPGCLGRMAASCGYEDPQRRRPLHEAPGGSRDPRGVGINADAVAARRRVPAPRATRSAARGLALGGCDALATKSPVGLSGAMSSERRTLESE